MSTTLAPNVALVPASSPTQSERTTAAIAHAGTCVAWFLAPLVVYLLERDRSAFVARQAMQALLWSVFGTLVTLATCGLAMPIFMGFHILAAVRVMEGHEFEYPLVTELWQRLRGR